MKAPFPYFGGKTQVASIVWDALYRTVRYDRNCQHCKRLGKKGEDVNAKT